MKTTIFDNGDFAYLADVSVIPAPVGGHCLTVTSLWRTAKAPDDEQIQLRVWLDGEGLRRLAILLAQEVVS